MKGKNLRYLVISLPFMCFTCPTEPTYIQIENASNKNIKLVNRPDSQYINEHLDSDEVIHPNEARNYDFSPTGLNNFLVEDKYVFYFKVDNRTDTIHIPLKDIIRGEQNKIIYNKDITKY